MAHRGFWRELKRRHVYRVAAAYAIVGWLLIQVATQVFPVFHLPDWIDQAVVLLILVGFPIALVLAWAFDARPQGSVRTDEPGSVDVQTPRRSRRAGILVGSIGVLVAVSAGAGWWHAERGRLASPAAHDKASVASVATPFMASTAATAAAAKPRVIPALPIAAQPIPAKSVAVLPFENLSADKNNAYFVAGMQDLILTKLADIGDLTVISRTSTAQYKSRPTNLKTIGKQLGVATLLEGSVQKAGNEVLINVQLIDAGNDHHIWAQSYQRTLKNVFGVEGEVAEKIAGALKAKLSPAETKRLATALSADPAANDLYLRAEYFTNRGDINQATAAWKQAIPLYTQTIAQAPDFALAQARLSYVESHLAWFGGGGASVQQLNADARAQAERALSLAPDLPEAHLAIGFSDYWGRGDYAVALTAFAAALKLRPNDAGALAARGYVERRQGRFEAAIASLQQALARDPRNTALAFELGQTYMMASRYAQAAALFQRASALDPGNVQAQFLYSSVILYRTGDVARALAAAQGKAPVLQLWRVTLLTYQRYYFQALTLLAGIADTPDNFSAVSPGPKALAQADLYRLAGDAARARPFYTQALVQSRAQLARQHGINVAFVRHNIAAAELGLGHTAAGLAAITAVQAILAKTPDQVYGPVLMEYNAQLYAEAERPDLAVPLLEKALATTGNGYRYSPVLLWVDPEWDPIRHDPRFQALLKKYAEYKPSVVRVAPPAEAGSHADPVPAGSS